MPDPDFEWMLAHPGIIGDREQGEIRTRCELAAARLSATRHESIPSAHELHLALEAPVSRGTSQGVAPGLWSPLLEEARKLKAFDDFKYLSDLRPRAPSAVDFDDARRHLGDHGPLDEATRRGALRTYIERHYELAPSSGDVDPALVSPRWTIDHPDASIRAAFDYVEDHWGTLVRNAAGPDGSSLIPSPYPVTIPAGRFGESYYWDTCFGCDGLLASGHAELARMQADNLLESIRRFGFVPNGQRQYYLSRSQPPLSAALVRRVVRQSLMEFASHGDGVRLLQLHRWLRERAVPLLEHELLGHWSNPETRFHAQSGLHHHWDDLQVDRPERHSADVESELGASLRDVRAMAESGLDFSAVYAGAGGQNELAQVAPVLLNSLLFGFAGDLAWLAGIAGLDAVRRRCLAAAAAKRVALNRYCWSAEQDSFRHYHLGTARWSTPTCFTVFAPLSVRACDSQRAAAVVRDGLTLLRPGGLAASSLDDSPHQWDGSNGWAPAQVLAIRGLHNYGYHAEAADLALRWVDTLAQVHARHGLFIERVDVVSRDIPHCPLGQYPVQPGFLWTNASFTWTLSKVLGFPLKAIPRDTVNPHASLEERRAA